MNSDTANSCFVRREINSPTKNSFRNIKVILYITEIYTKKQYKSSITKNYRIKKKKRFFFFYIVPLGSLLKKAI